MKNRKRETCTSGTVRDEDGNILIYSAAWQRGGDVALTKGQQAIRELAGAPSIKDLILSHHPARVIARRLPPSAEISGSSRDGSHAGFFLNRCPRNDIAQCQIGNFLFLVT